MAEPIPIFFDPERPPAGGGWSYPYDPSRPQEVIQGYSADYVIQQVQRFRQNNGLPSSVEDITREVWAYWCEREPGRCSNLQAAATPPTANGQRVITKEFAGPIIWRHLNLAAAQYDEIGHNVFASVVASVAPMVTCPTCKAHWNRTLAEIPMEAVNSARTACQWVLSAHNAANRVAGKPPYNYQQGVADFGWPPL